MPIHSTHNHITYLSKNQWGMEGEREEERGGEGERERGRGEKRGYQLLVVNPEELRLGASERPVGTFQTVDLHPPAYPTRV